jgi:hypothetical protein
MLSYGPVRVFNSNHAFYQQCVMFANYLVAQWWRADGERKMTARLWWSSFYFFIGLPYREAAEKKSLALDARRGIALRRWLRLASGHIDCIVLGTDVGLSVCDFKARFRLVQINANLWLCLASRHAMTVPHWKRRGCCRVWAQMISFATRGPKKVQVSLAMLFILKSSAKWEFSNWNFALSDLEKY